MHCLFPSAQTAHTPSPWVWGDSDVDSLSTGWVSFFQRQVKLAVCQQFFLSFLVFFSVCLSTLSLLSFSGCSVHWPATSFLFPVTIHTYMHTVSLFCQPLCAAWRLNSSQSVDLSTPPVCVYMQLSRLQYSYGDEKYSFLEGERGGKWCWWSRGRKVRKETSDTWMHWFTFRHLSDTFIQRDLRESYTHRATRGLDDC